MADAASGAEGAVARFTAPKPTGLLLKLRGNHSEGLSLTARGLAQDGEVIFEVQPDRPGELGLAGDQPALWVRTAAADNPWDQAHVMMRMGFAAGSGDLLAAEPDFQQGWVEAQPEPDCHARVQTGANGRPIGPGPNWHLEPQFSGLGQARTAVDAAAQRRILIAHLDTGYQPEHHYRAPNIAEGERNFADEGDPTSARDVSPAGMLSNYGHGVGTQALLASAQVGGAPGATILPIRIADSVVRFTTGSMAKGFRYALDSGAQVLSMSMGGLASGLLADAVNACYAAGMVMVTAAGNNINGLPVRSTVYPARMRRVVAACGVMSDGRPYAGLDGAILEGCFGPSEKMKTAVSGFTPNTPWAQIGCPDTLHQDGQGTSCATPQIAAAAALWMAQHAAALQALPQAWMRGEAARQALFRTASLAGSKPDPKLGWGALRAFEMLKFAPLAAGALELQPMATARWDWVKLLSGQGVGVAVERLSGPDRLLSLELMQLVQIDPALATLLDQEGIDPDGQVTTDQRRRVLEAAEASPFASRTLKRALAGALAARPAGAGRPGPPPSLAAAAAPAPAPGQVQLLSPPAAPPAQRRLRIFALDPSLGGSLNSYEQQIATISVRNEPDLKPGPVGEYLEVVDVDPASDRFYGPVNLNDLNLALQDGVTPSEGNPAFHQQMVYAVAMRTIDNFERALGRRALWSPQWNGKRSPPDRFVPQLRLYPHALRQGNAYYSPDKKALLFGYFPANSKVSDLTPPGTMVFSCLSSDIIAHETTHALLDGQSRGFREASNPDVRAFHEAFADIVALFQQFTYRDLVRREIAGAHGKLSAAALLGGLARQFGEGAGKSGPLRRYGQDNAELSYETTFETHDRGALLVGAIYQAFLAIVERRTNDLIRLATGGSGVLPQGALHPDLVERLTDETTRAARHVLNMCIRAIDYTPPVDITFGEYLRAIITADLEQVPDDRFGYRVAFLEAFRRLELLPRSLRTVSIETLQWHRWIGTLPGWAGPRPDWLEPAVKAMKIQIGADLPREEIYAVSKRRRAILHDHLLSALGSPQACEIVGLEPGLPRYASPTKSEPAEVTTFEVDNLRIARRVRDDGVLTAEIYAVLRQRRPEPLYTGEPGGESFWFRGGSTVVIDLFGRESPRLKYVIRKPMTPSRLARERAFRQGDAAGSLRAMYFGGGPGAAGFREREPFAIMHAERS